MKPQPHTAPDGFTVDPAVLRNAGTTLHEAAASVQQIDVELAAETMPAARAFDGLATGAALVRLGDFWHADLADLARHITRIGDALADAASAYKAADVHAQRAVDPNYHRGR